MYFPEPIASIYITGTPQRYIHEHDAVREILMACQGYKNSFLRWAQSDNGRFSFEVCIDIILSVL